MHRLALAFGCTVRELGVRMSSVELTEWIAYYDHEPWGSYVDGYRHAVTASCSLNAGLMMADPKKLRNKAFNPEQVGVGLRKDSSLGDSNVDRDWTEQRKMLNRVLGKKC